MISKDVLEMQARLCQALSHVARLEIIQILRDGPQSVNILAQTMGLSQNTLSRHLAVLRHYGLVIAQRNGQENIYQLANPRIVVICGLLHQILTEQLTHQGNLSNKLARLV